ncbi:MAG: hypothetical protein WC624_00280 [Candidatus Margulisiibacteriota bacterium]
MSTIGSTPPPANAARLYGAAVAQHHGYTNAILQGVVRKIGSFERRLFSLFGPSFEPVKITSVAFTDEKKGMIDDPIAIVGKELIINPSQNPPLSLLKKFDFYLAHEYGHVLTLDHNILWQGVSENTKTWAAQHMRLVRAGNLDKLKALDLLKIFARSLAEGISSPFVTGLKSEAFDIYRIYEKIAAENEDYESAEFIMDCLLFALGEVVANRIAVLTMPDKPANGSVIREDIRDMIGDPRDVVTFSSAAAIRVLAEKTGNADLVQGFNIREYKALYEETRQIFSALWDGIKLKSWE